MEKYRVLIEGKEYLVEIEGDRVWFDGQEVYAGIHFLNNDGLFMIERDESKREFHIKAKDEDTFQVTTRGLQTEAVVEPEKKRRKKTEEKSDSGNIKAPIPGVVMNIAVAEGDQVEANQVLVVLESMKMLMDFRSPFAGTVEKILVTKGNGVEKGDEMVRIKGLEED
jgi:biotin carboxyl carrier protein